MGIDIQEQSVRKVRMRIAGMRKRVQNPQAVWPRVGSYMSRTMNRQFVTEGAHLLGRPWQPLQPSYRLWKIRHGYSRKILVQTGDMRRTFTSRPMEIEQYHGTYAVFGSNSQKAVWHHYGTRRHGKRVNPPRPIMVSTPQMRRDIRNIIASYVVGKRKSNQPMQGDF